MEIFENLRPQNSAYPLQGRVFEGLAREEVLDVAATLVLDAGSPTMAVRSSLGDGNGAGDVAVAFRSPKIATRVAVYEEGVEFEVIRLLG
jgi:hypothetical protein